MRGSGRRRIRGMREEASVVVCCGLVDEEVVEVVVLYTST